MHEPIKAEVKFKQKAEANVLYHVSENVSQQRANTAQKRK